MPGEHAMNDLERKGQPVTEPRVPRHMRRARLARRTQIVLALAAAIYAIYRLTAAFRGAPGTRSGF
jgi:hypothetical protein